MLKKLMSAVKSGVRMILSALAYALEMLAKGLRMVVKLLSTD